MRLIFNLTPDPIYHKEDLDEGECIYIEKGAV
jgi:hypothetical protein